MGGEMHATRACSILFANHCPFRCLMTTFHQVSSNKFLQKEETLPWCGGPLGRMIGGASGRWYLAGGRVRDRNLSIVLLTGKRTESDWETLRGWRPCQQCCGSVIFWYGSWSGSADPHHWLTDPYPDTAFFLQWLTRCLQKISLFWSFFAYYFLKVLYIFISLQR
jgi:hypothetical protein